MTAPIDRQFNPATGIGFYRVTAQAALLEVLAPFYSSSDIRHWLDFGAIYVDGRRERTNVTLAPDQIVRVHTRPKRFTWPPGPLLSRVVHTDNDFLVLDKPGGLPTHPTLDNFHENAKVQLERELGQTLFTTHRLDVPTQGLLIFARTAEAQRALNKAFAKGHVHKTYRARLGGAVAPGEYVHFMDAKSRVPKVVHEEAMPGWWECRLRVDSAWPLAGGDTGVEIQLLTGRTHQIRAQMAALGGPIVGDRVYGGRVLVDGKKQVVERIELECLQLSFRFRSTTFRLTRRQSIVPSSIDGARGEL